MILLYLPLCLVCDPKAAGAATDLSFFSFLGFALETAAPALSRVAAAVSSFSLQGYSSSCSGAGVRCWIFPALGSPASQGTATSAVSLNVLIICSCLKSARLGLQAACVLLADS